jgi:Complex I intermediate-associated protein 30 (CIA30)
VRSPTASAQPEVETVDIAWDQPLSAQPNGWSHVAAVVCVDPSPAVVERLMELAAMPSQRDETLLVDFTQPQADLQNTWGALDDVVMGGVSSSNLRLISGAALFAGAVSTANSGGFASVRSRNIDPPLDLSAYEGFALRLQGDGQRYKFLARCEDRWDGVAYSASFDTTANEWTTVRLPFQDLIPVFRARTVSNGEPINRSRITSLQLMLSKFEYDGALNPAFSPGEFQLKIAAIAAYRVASPLTVIWVGSDQSQLLAAQQAFDAAGLPSSWVTATQQSANLMGDSATLAQYCAEAIAP